MREKVKPFIRLRWFSEGAGGIFAMPFGESSVDRGAFVLIKIGYRPFHEYWNEQNARRKKGLPLLRQNGGTL